MQKSNCWFKSNSKIFIVLFFPELPFSLPIWKWILKIKKTMWHTVSAILIWPEQQNYLPFVPQFWFIVLRSYLGTLNRKSVILSDFVVLTSLCLTLIAILVNSFMDKPNSSLSTEPEPISLTITSQYLWTHKDVSPPLSVHELSWTQTYTPLERKWEEWEQKKV